MRTLVVATDAPTVLGPPQGHWRYRDWEALPADGNIFVFISTAKVSILNAGRIRGVPDLIIEILSPNQIIYDTQIKLVAYAMAGVPEYAIIDPRSRTLDHYRLHAPGRYDGPQTYPETTTMQFDCLPTVGLPIAELFAGAPDTSL